ncbi:MAG TPA: DUF3883 domain-containing protein [Caulobacteraceae bacterium]|nr:DUF3883 domain-containing protein [Caulobacteraceae bacterium]
MANEERHGTDWSDGEVDLIVADYFAMLEAELAGEAYVKSHRAALLMERIGRSHKSVEFKHQNISAVVAELGLPTIQGYKPKTHYQRSLVEGVRRFLLGHPGVLPALDMTAPRAFTAALGRPSLLPEVAPPEVNQAPWVGNVAMERLVRRFDPAAREANNRMLGAAGEELVFNNEQRRLRDLQRSDLARRVRWISREEGDGAGYDILSFDTRGAERFIEVKTTRGSRTTPFFLTRNEHELSEERPDSFRLFRVFEFGQSPGLFRLRPPIGQAVSLSPEVYRAAFTSASR